MVFFILKFLLAQPAQNKETCNFPFLYSAIFKNGSILEQECYHCCNEDFSCSTTVGLSNCEQGFIYLIN